MFVALLSRLLDVLLPDPLMRQAAQKRLSGMQADAEFIAIRSSFAKALAPTRATPDRWTIRARPAFLYVMYAIILSALPLGIIAAISPATSHAMADAISRYLTSLPESLYTLFGTGYLGYATLRQWGKVKGADR
jgi:hypothetical protein